MVVGGALLCPQGLGEISSKCTIPAHDKAVRGIGVPDNPWRFSTLTAPYHPT